MKKYIPALLLLMFTAAVHAGSPQTETTTESAPIPFSEIGAKATADYKGDAIGIRVTAAGAELRTGFQKLAGTVTTEGLRLESTEAGGGSLKLSAAAIGRVGSSSLALPLIGRVAATEQVVSFIRPGLAEEFSVSVDGLRQDFVVAERPLGSGALRVELALSGARAETAADGVKLTLNGSGRELAYHRLIVTDATDRALTATLEILSPDRLAVRVEDAGAVYPVRIDPTFSDADWVSLNPGVPGANSTVQSMVVDGSGNLFVGGDFTVIGTVAANCIAKWNGSAWSVLGTGMNSIVRALAVSGSDLYAGGNFTTAGGTSANYIAKWNGTSWSALGTGINGAVSALAVSGSDLYAGGMFSTAGGTTVNSIAKWNGSAWSALGTGTNGAVSALAVSGSDLYAGGIFSTAGGVNIGYGIAKWNGSAWSALGTGMDGQVLALAVSGSDLYAGGNFNTAGGTPANYIAKWNGSAWSALGTGMSNTVRSLAVSGSDLYAGGIFNTAGGTSANSIAKWNGSAWSALGTGMNNQVYALAVSGSELYAGGIFITAGGTSALRIAKWNGSAWSALGTGMDNSVNALAVSGSDLYAGGIFTTAGGTTVNRIAKWNGSAWSALGTGMNNSVFALAVSGSDLYAGGNFYTAGGTSANYIAKWNGSAWSALGTGMNFQVSALAVSGSDLYAGGNFTTAGGMSALRIAKWNGSAWSALGTGMDNSVNALAVSGSDLYAGGVFTTAGGTSANYIAKWNGSAWSTLGTGMNNSVFALAVSGSDLYAGGNFGTAGGTSANCIAKWNGSAWSALGTGMGNTVRSLAVSGSDLYAGGQFTTAGGTTVNSIAKWNGSAWSALGTGTNGQVSALAVSGSDKLFLGGSFTVVGTTTVSPFIAQANLPPPPTVTAATGTLASNSPTLTLTGTGFDTTPGNNTVVFNNGAVGTVTAATATELTVTFSTQPTSYGSLTAVVTNSSGSSGAPVQVATVSNITATLTGGELTITDVADGNDTILLGESAGDLVITADAASIISSNAGTGTGTNVVSIPLASITGLITVNAAGGNDTINVGAFGTALNGLTINGDAGNDTVNLNGDITFAADTDLDVNLQNDSGIASGPNLILNGDFELGLVGPGVYFSAGPYGAWTQSVGNTGLIGMPYSASIPDNGSGEAVHIGAAYSPGAISQAFSTTIGATYEVSVNVVGYAGASGTAQVKANGIVVGNYVAPAGGVWTTSSHTFVAASTSTTLQIQNVAGASTIDDVVVQLVSVGTDIVNVATNANLILSGAGTATVKASKNVAFASGSSLETEDGDLTIEANQQGTPTGGSFVGIDITAATIQSATGYVQLAGRVGTGGGIAGIFAKNSSNIRTTGATGSVSITGLGSAGSGSAGVILNNGVQVTTGGAGTVDVTGTGGTGNFSTNIGVFLNGSPATMVSSGGGAVTVSGIGGGAGGVGGANFGVILQGAAVITSGGSGLVAVDGTGGSSAAGGNVGVYVDDNSKITSSGGNVVTTGTGGTGANSFGVKLTATASITTAVNGGSNTLIADSMDIGGAVAANSVSSVTLRQETNGQAINLGAADSTGVLGLTDAELDLITAGTLAIGDANSGAITISAVISPAGYNLLDVQKGVSFSATGGFDSDVTSATVFEKIRANGAVSINTSAILTATAVGGFVPSDNDSFTILDNSSASTTTGNFSGKPEGTVIAIGGVNKRISYMAGTGNDVVLTTPTVSIDASGNLAITDTAAAGEDNTFVIVVVGSGPTATYRITDVPNGIDESVLISDVTGKIIVNGNGGDDTLTVDYSAGNILDEIEFHGGGNVTSMPGDQLVIVGGSFATATYNYTNANDGTIQLTGQGLITYTGLEPISNSGTATNVILNLPAGDDAATLTDNGTTLTIDGLTFETTVFTKPTDSLTINGGAGADSLTLTNALDLSGANVSFDLETINLDGGTVNTGTGNQTYIGAVVLGTGNVLTAANINAGDVNLGVNTLTATVSGTTGIVSGGISGDGGFIKGGAGSLRLIGDNSYIGNTAINGGLLTLGSNTNASSPGRLGGGSYGGNISIAAGATLAIRTTQDQVLSGIISGGGNLTKAYGGKLTLSDVNTYSGTTSFTPLSTASFGTVAVSSFNSVSGGTPLAASSSLGAPTNGTIFFGSGSAQAGGTLQYTGPGETTNRVIQFNMNGSGAGKTLDASGSGLLKFTSPFTITGSNTNDMTLTGTGEGEIVGGLNFVFRNFSKTGNGTWTLGGAVNSTGTYTVSTGTLIATHPQALGNGSGPSIQGSGTLSLRNDSNVVFGIGGSGYNISNSASGATIDVGRVSGTGSNILSVGNLTTTSTSATWQLNLSGGNGVGLNAGTLTLPATASATTHTVNNTIAGGGSLTLAGISGGGTGTAALRFNGDGDTTVTGAIAPAATGQTLTKNGNGTLTLNGNNSYTGLTSVNAGTLGGTGTIAGAVNVATAGNLAPGNSVTPAGTLSMSSLDISAMAAGSGKIAMELDSTAPSDRIDVGGTLTIGSGALGLSDFAFTINDFSSLLADTTYTLISSTNPISGSLAAGDSSTTFGDSTITLKIIGNNLVLEVVLDDYDNDGTPDRTDTDDDNDGFPDVVEVANGTDPFDENSTPAAAFAVAPFSAAEGDAGTTPFGVSVTYTGVTTGSGFTIPFVTTPTGEVLHYTLDEAPATNGVTLADSSGSGHSATLNLASGDAAVPGRFGGALSLPGNNITDYAIANPLSGAWPTTALTVSAWVKSTLPSSANRYFFSYAVPSADNEILISASDVIINGAGLTITPSLSPILDDNQFHHVTMTWDSAGGALAIYVDGVQEFTGTVANGGSIDPGGSLVLGQDQDSVGGNFDANQAFGGLIDEVAVFNRALTPAEVANLANGTAVPPGDYDATGGTLTFAGTNGETQTATVQVVGDEVVELDETFTLSVPGASGTVTITNDDTATITIADATPVLETDSGTTQLVFDVTLDNAVDVPLTVDYGTQDDTATTADSDYTAKTGTLSFSGAAGQTLQVTVDVTGDCTPEADETLRVLLSNVLASGRESSVAISGGGGGGGGSQSVFANVPEASGYTLVYDLAIPNTLNFQTSVPYSTNNSASIPNGSFDRVAYYLELDNGSGSQYVYVSVDAFTPNAALIGVPSFAGSNTVFQQPLANMNVVSNKPGIITGTGIATGNIEFWPYNYGEANSASVPGANGSTFDFGDFHSGSSSYGSMQIHNFAAGQTLFALNSFQSNTPGEMGIGNATSGPNPDWTFTNNGGTYTVKNLQILVRSRGATGTILNDDFAPQVTGSGIADTTIYTSSPQVTVPLFPAFEDADDADTALTYTVTANTNAGLVMTSAISSVNGILTIDTPCDLSGTADITVTVQDPCGLTVTDTFTVTVIDDILPVINCAKDIVVTVPLGGPTDQVFYTPIGYDACEGLLANPVICTPPSGSTFPVGSNTVSCSVTDSGGNTVTASFEVIVIEQQDVNGFRYLDAVSLRGDAVDGVPAAIVMAVNNAFLNNNGDVLFDASLQGNGTNNYGLFLRPSGGATTTVAVRGDSFGPGSYGIFSNLALNDSGTLGFQSLTSGNRAGHFVGTGAGVSNTALRLAASPTGDTYNGLYQPALASNGELLTPAALLIGGGIGIDNDTLIASSAAGGTVLAREGDVPAGIANTVYGQMLARVVAGNANGHYAFPCYLNATPQDKPTNMAVFTGVLGGAAPAVAVRKGDPAAGAPGGAFENFLGESVNSSGELALRANVSGAGITAADNEGIWTNSGNPSGPPVLVAREGDVAPCIAGGLAAFSSFKAIYMGDDGSVCFLAYLKDATGVPAVNPSNDASIWLWRNGVLDLVVREGELANNTDGAVIARIGNFESTGEVGGGNGIVYVVDYVPGSGDVTSRTNQAVYVDRGSEDLAPLLVLRRGDSFDVGGTMKDVLFLRVGTAEATSPSGSTGGYGRAINDAGGVLLKIDFTGSSSGIFVLGTPPGP